MDNLLLENISHDDLKKYIQEYYNYAKKELNLERDPKLFLKKDQTNANDLLGKTGYYDPDNEEIFLFITDRHAKDIIRSFAHELIHHDQKTKGFDQNIDLSITAKDPSYALHNKELREMERDAFERGNMMFRSWTDTKKMERKNIMAEESYEKSGLKNPQKADLNKDKNISGYEKKRGKAIEKSMTKENKMKIKIKGVKKEGSSEVEEARRDDEEELDVVMSKPTYKAGMSDFEYGEREKGKRASVDTGEEASIEDIEDLELDDEGGEEEIAPKRMVRQPADKYDSAGSFDRAWKEREARLRAQSRAAVEDEPLMSDEELDALIAKREAEKEARRRELESDPEYQAMMADLDKEEMMQESKKNPYPVLFEQRERLLNEAFKTKEERVYNELLRRFIKK